MQHHTLFISDLHLSPDYPQITQLFLDFLKHQAPAADALYILGDLFEAWVGDDNLTDFNRMIQAKIKELTQTGKPVFFMHGNRDFLIGKQFAKHTGCRLIKDPTFINLYGTKVLLIHGDSLCTEDKKHQAFRQKYAGPFPILPALFLLLPLSIRKKIAAKIRTNSMQRGYELTNTMMDVVQSEVENLMRKYQAEYLIHGHTHKAHIHEFLLDNKPAQRIVLGDWYQHGSALQWNEDGSHILKQISK